MNIKHELLKLMQNENITIEKVAKMTNIAPEKLKKRFDNDKIRYSDAKKILDILGYEINFIKRL